MNRLILVLGVAASLTLLGGPTAFARGTGGAHPSESHSSQPQHSEAQHGSPQSGQPHANQSQTAYHGTNVPLPTDAGFGGSSSGKSATGAAAAEHKHPDTSGAAAGYAATEKNQPQVSGAAGAAAGHAASEKNQPQVSGAAGAAAGYAATEKNQPQVSGAAGAAAGHAAAERNQPQVSGAAGAAAGYAAASHRTTAVPDSVAVARGASVRTAYGGSNLYGQGWYAANPGAWKPAGWSAGQVWGMATWPTIGASMGWAANAPPISYNYGTNITYQNDQVYSGGQRVATADEYYQQASNLAQSASPPDSNAPDWMPLGVFALVQNDQAEPHFILQLAVNKAGTLGGNYSDLISGTTLPIQGGVDQASQRVAWTVGSNKTTVGETGLYNLTQDEAPALIHIGKDKTQQWLLVRLKPPQEASGAK